MGDKDRAVHIFRSDLLRRGVKLSQATEALAEALGVEQKVVPMTDDHCLYDYLYPGRSDALSGILGRPQGEAGGLIALSFTGTGAGPSQPGIPGSAGKGGYDSHRSQQSRHQHRPHPGPAGRARAAAGQKGGGNEPLRRESAGERPGCQVHGGHGRSRQR